jgi:hypothetical protein
MRSKGLVLENLDGFDQPGVMRSVPHTLGLGLSIRNNRDDFPLPGNEALGWSGDGAPGDGTLREFAIGAVVQHFPKTLKRRACSLTEFEADPSVATFVCLPRWSSTICGPSSFSPGATRKLT